jgi:hypothetical protein
MPRKLEISITLGDDAMITKDDVYRTVTRVVERMEDDMESWAVIPDFRALILDANGNSAGCVTLTGGE